MSPRHKVDVADGQCTRQLTVREGQYPSLLVLRALERSSGEIVINYENGLVERQSYILDEGQGAALSLLKPSFTPQIVSIDINGGCVVASLQM